MDGCLALEHGVYEVRSRVMVSVKVMVRVTVTVRVHKFRYINIILFASECKSLWGKPERVYRISAVNIEDECIV